jgi:hypothetical protein
MVPTAYMAHENRVWSDTPTKLHWFWIEDNAPDSVFHLEPEEAIANGPHPYLVIPSRKVQLALLAVNAQGVRRHATLQFPFERVGEILPSEIEIFQVDKTLSSLTGPEMTLQERTQWETQPATFVQEGGVGRFVAQFADDTVIPDRTRWMTTGPFGTFFETNETSADWAAADAELEEDEFIVHEVLSPGVRMLTALSLDAHGPLGIAFRDLWVGEPQTGLQLGQRWLAAPAGPYPKGLYQVVFEADDHAPSGLAVNSIIPVNEEELPKVDPYGTQSLPCETPVSELFSLQWLTTGHCLRTQVLHSPLVVEVK